MAHFEVKERHVCPFCKAEAYFSIWSCGCKTLSKGFKGHKPGCECLDYFETLLKHCGQEGEIRSHKNRVVEAVK